MLIKVMNNFQWTLWSKSDRRSFESKIKEDLVAACWNPICLGRSDERTPTAEALHSRQLILGARSLRPRPEGRKRQQSERYVFNLASSGTFSFSLKTLKILLARNISYDHQ